MWCTLAGWQGFHWRSPWDLKRHDSAEQVAWRPFNPDEMMEAAGQVVPRRFYITGRELRLYHHSAEGCSRCRALLERRSAKNLAHSEACRIRSETAMERVGDERWLQWKRTRDGDGYRPRPAPRHAEGASRSPHNEGEGSPGIQRQAHLTFHLGLGQ